MHIQEIVNAFMLTEPEKELMEEYTPLYTTDIIYSDKENRYVERITIPNPFDMARQDRKPQQGQRLV